MDSITHALYKAITADDEHQRAIAGFDNTASSAGLRPLSERRSVHQSYADAEPTDLHISLTRGAELLALQLEFIAAGYTPPAGLYEHGADVIISPGRIDVYAATDNGRGTWSAILTKDPRNGPGGGLKARWEEDVA